MESKNLTPTQQKKKYQKIKWACFGGEFLSIIAPFVTIGLINFNEYFIEYDGVKMSIACFLALALMGMAVWLVSKKKFSNSFVSLIIGWATVDFIFFMLGRIINDIASIMFFGLIGLLGAYGLDIASNVADKKMKKIIEGIEEANKEITKESYKEELKEKEEKRTVKIRIKKDK